MGGGVRAADGPASAQTMLGFGTWRPGYCLEAVWNAYKANGAIGDGGYYPTAYSAWKASRTQHRGDWNPPLGVPCFFEPPRPDMAGDVVISWGDGLCVATDYNNNKGQIGIQKLSDRAWQIGDEYLGWTEDICGAPVLFGQTPPDGGDRGNEDEMKGGYYTRSSDKATVFLLFNDESGWYTEHTGATGPYNNNLANYWQTNPWAPITESHANAIKRGLDAVRNPKLTLDVTVDIDPADAVAAERLGARVEAADRAPGT